MISSNNFQIKKYDSKMTNPKEIIRSWKGTETSISATNDILLFKKISNYINLISYMTGAVMNKVGSPIYNFVRPDTLMKYDNHWWTENDERYQILIKINSMGLITLNCEEGLLDREERNFWHHNICAINVRTSLSLLLPNNMVSKFKNSMEKEGYIVLFGTNLFNIKTCTKFISLVEIVMKTGEIKVNSSLKLNDKSYTWGHDDIEEFTNPNFSEKIKKLTTELTIVDPIFNRPNNMKEGLFKTILDYLENEENYFTAQNRII